MLPTTRLLCRLVQLVPPVLAGERFHRLGLEALATGDPRLADRLFERAALAYRRELAIEPLARLRVHQRVARVRFTRDPDAEREIVLAIERGMSQLERIEEFVPPFRLVRTHTLLARWSERHAAMRAGEGDAQGDRPGPLAAERAAA